jgi:hypothetical protein
MIKSPFVGSEALSAGLITERALRRLCKPVYPNIYASRGVTPSAQQRARAAWLWSKRRGIVAGLSAAATLGAKWIDPSEPAELIQDNRRPPPNLIVRTERVLPEEVVGLAGMRVTTPARTDPAVRQRDIDKQFALTELGWIVIRASRDLLRYRRAT